MTARARGSPTTTTSCRRPRRTPASVMQHLEFCHQVLWPELDVQMVSVDRAMGAVFDRRARAPATRCKGSSIRRADISNAAFPYMGGRRMHLCGGMPARLFRLSFSGELAYEIGVPARYGDALIRAIMQAGEPFGIAPYGTEALGRHAHRERPCRRQ